MAWVKDIKQSANTNDVAQLIIKTINDYSHSQIIKDIVKQYNGNPKDNIVKFTKWLFDFCCKHITYKRDPQGWERIYTPERLMREGFGDCKKFTTLIAAVLKYLGYDKNIRLKIVSYDGKNWEHIYPILLLDNSKYITLDPVNYCQYNKEVAHSKALKYYLNGQYMEIQGNRLSQMGNVFNLSNIAQGADAIVNDIDGISIGFLDRSNYPEQIAPLNELYKLSGCDCAENTPIGKLFKKSKEERKQKRQEILNKAKNAGMAIPRAAFLGLIALGPAMEKTSLKFDLAKKLAEAYQRNPNLIKDTWTKLGGDPKALVAAVRSASGVNISGNDYSNNERSTPVMVAGIGAVTATAVVTAIATATPVLMALLKSIKDAGVLTTEEAVASDATQEAAENTFTDSGTPKIKVTLPLAKDKKAAIIRRGDEIQKQSSAKTTSTTSTTNTTTEGAFINFKKLTDINTFVKAVLLGFLLGAANQNIFTVVISTTFIIYGLGGLCLTTFKYLKHKFFNQFYYGKF